MVTPATGSSRVDKPRSDHVAWPAPRRQLRGVELLAFAVLGMTSLGCAGGRLFADFCDESHHDQSTMFSPGISSGRTFDVTLTSPLNDQPCIDNAETWGDFPGEDRLVVRCSSEWCAEGYEGYYCTRPSGLEQWAGGDANTASGMGFRIEDWGDFNVAISDCDAHGDQEFFYRPAKEVDSADTADP